MQRTPQHGIGHKFLALESAEEYVNFVIDWLFPDRDILNHPFYAKVAQFVLVEKAPIFFVAHSESERIAFTTPYNIIPIPQIRGRYESPTVFSLTNLHEFFHALFGYPQKISQTTVDQFDEDMMIREAAASNATEVLIHYDLPLLRERIREVFPIIWFDILYHQMQRKNRPNVAELLRLRRDWLKSNAYDWLYCDSPDHPVAKFMGKWRTGNETYWHKRLKKLNELPRLQGAVSRSLSPTFYEEEISSYSAKVLEQSDYERLQLYHASVLYALAGRLDDAPRSFSEFLERSGELEDFNIVLQSEGGKNG